MRKDRVTTLLALSIFQNLDPVVRMHSQFSYLLLRGHENGHFLSLNLEFLLCRMGMMIMVSNSFR